MKAIGIIGAGQMGAGIAQVSAQSGFQVFLADIGLPQAEAGKAKIAKQISRLVEKDKMDAKTAEALLDRIEPVADYAPLAAADLVIEAATERRSEEHTSELQSLMRISYAVFCLKKKKNNQQQQDYRHSKQRIILYYDITSTH